MTAQTAPTLNAIEAAQMEARGDGAFSLIGRSIQFRAGHLTFNWSASTPKAAAQQLRIFRAAPKYMGA